MNKFAIVQMCSCASVGINLISARRKIMEAANAEAKVVILPDHFALLSKQDSDYDINKEVLGEGRIQNFIQKCAFENRIWIIASGIPLVSEYTDDKYYLATVVYNDEGHLVEVYYQLKSIKPNGYHDVFNGFDHIEYGQHAKVVETPYGNIGLTSSNDLYSPEIFRYLKQQGADIFAFCGVINADIGAVAWWPILRTRAIENQTIVLAANQCGYHEDTALLSFGHSAAITANGQTIVYQELGEKVLIMDIDPSTFSHINFTTMTFQLQYRRR
ncbi:MAG: nitrilase-related carbon-nitrogen hydrolase [Francisellaceae bacterium]